MSVELKDFYPTPKHLINKMLSGLSVNSNTSILEPSAGKGDIVDEIKKEHRYVDIECIEYNADLRSILKGKKYNVIYNDFLTFNTFKKYDLIIMNPPFSEGDKHLLKALELQKDGGQIVCLLNAETIKNPYSVYRKDLVRKLEEYNAKIEYLQDQFTSDNTFRKTNVEIALIKVDIPKKKRKSEILQGLKESLYKTQDDVKIKNELISSNFIEGLIQQYDFEMQAGIKLINEFNAIKGSFLRTFDSKETWNKGSILSLTVNNSQSNSNQNLTNEFVKMVRDKYWRALFESKEFVSISTSGLRERYYEKLKEMKLYEFNLENILLIQAELKAHLYTSIEDTIIALFDELSYQYSYEDFSSNIHYYNGWKTNKSWKINNRVIIMLNGFSWYDKNSLDLRDYKIKSKLDDMEKVFNYLDSGLTKDINLEEVLKEAQDKYQSKNIECKYFTLTFYKKGTCHITFKDLDLLQKFNLFGSLKKGWLPPSFGNTEYKNMNREEQEVVNNFCGEEEYNKIFERKDYYIHSMDNIKLLG